MTPSIILITGASSGFGQLSARALAQAGHTVYASMRETTGRNADKVEELKRFAQDKGVDLRSLELDVQDEKSTDAAVKTVVSGAGRLDVLIHNAGHMTLGPAEAFTPEQLAQIYDVNVLGTQRLNRSALPLMRVQKHGLLLWVSSTSTRGGTPPYLGPYFAAKAAMDALAISYAGELSRWGIETSIIVPGAFTSGTNHFKNAGSPDDKARLAEYDNGPYAHFQDDLAKGFSGLVPPNDNVQEVADAIVRVVNTPFGQRPFRVHIDRSSDGAEVVNAVADRVRAEYVRRIGIGDVLTPAVNPA